MEMDKRKQQLEQRGRLTIKSSGRRFHVDSHGVLARPVDVGHVHVRDGNVVLARDESEFGINLDTRQNELDRSGTSGLSRDGIDSAHHRPARLGVENGFATAHHRDGPIGTELVHANPNTVLKVAVRGQRIPQALDRIVKVSLGHLVRMPLARRGVHLGMNALVLVKILTIKQILVGWVHLEQRVHGRTLTSAQVGFGNKHVRRSPPVKIAMDGPGVQSVLVGELGPRRRHLLLDGRFAIGLLGQVGHDGESGHVFWERGLCMRMVRVQGRLARLELGRSGHSHMARTLGSVDLDPFNGWSFNPINNLLGNTPAMKQSDSKVSHVRRRLDLERATIDQINVPQSHQLPEVIPRDVHLTRLALAEPNRVDEIKRHWHFGGTTIDIVGQHVEQYYFPCVGSYVPLMLMVSHIPLLPTTRMARGFIK
jgi:hypothetical protein